MKKIPTKPQLVACNDGKLRHPLLALRETHTLVDVAKALGHANHTTVAIYVSRAKKKPTMKIPAEWVPALCKLVGWRPAQLRPDLYRPEWSFE